MRRPLELVLRLAGIGALLVALILSWRAQAGRSPTASERVSDAALQDSTGRTLVSELSSRIVRAARDSAWPTVSQSFTRIPDRVLREVLASPVAAGMPLRWVDSTGAVGLAVAASSALDPQGGSVVRAVGAPMRPLLVRDDGGVLDSVPDAVGGVTVRGARVSGLVLATQGASRAVAMVPVPPTLKRVLLIARPGWEAKFTAAALEERGWHVDGSLRIARNASVTIGMPSVLDSARYGAAIVLDSGVVSRSVLERFVLQGGGVVVANDALQDATLRAMVRSLAPATRGESQPGVPGALLTASPRLGLDAWTLRAGAGAVVLLEDVRGTARRPAVIAERRGVGRVLVSAYRDTWRWRMEGNDDGVDAHRAFWSGLVSAAILAPRSALSAARVESAYPGDAAAFADLVARLGTPSSGTGLEARARPSPLAPRLWLLYVVAAITLLGEWMLRRVRGAP